MHPPQRGERKLCRWSKYVLAYRRDGVEDKMGCQRGKFLLTADS